MESMLKRISRHITTGEIGPKTIKRGLGAFVEWAKSYDILNSTLVTSGIEKDFISIPGLNKYTYSYLAHEGFRDYGAFEVIEFPKASHLEVDVNLREPEEVKDHLIKRRGAIAEFVGPTVLYSGIAGGQLPNNGFFYKGMEKLHVPFMDTNPSWKDGVRRGAVLIDKKGVTRILTDAQKWDIVKSDYANCEVMFGTSTYFTNTDLLDNNELFQALDRDRVSYLIQYIDENNDERFCYAHISAFIPRMIAKYSIDQHIQGIKAKSYIACELELLGAGCSARKGRNIQRVTTIQPLIDRIDHYVVVSGAEKSKSRIPSRRRS